jgi:hypothetical protein
MSRWGRWVRFEPAVICGYFDARYLPRTNGKRKAR